MNVVAGTGRSPTAARLGDWLLAHGRTSVTTEQAAALLGIPAGHVRVRLNRPVHEGLFSLTPRLATANLYAKLADPEFRTDLDLLTTSRPAAYEITSAADLVATRLLARL